MTLIVNVKVSSPKFIGGNIIVKLWRITIYWKYVYLIAEPCEAQGEGP